LGSSFTATGAIPVGFFSVSSVIRLLVMAILPNRILRRGEQQCSGCRR
jgi:hypothetical protein